MADSAAVTLEQLTAFGYVPGGAPSLEQATASGYEPGGAPSLEQLTASGTIDNFDAAGAGVLESFDAAGAAPGSFDATGEPSLEHLTSEAYEPYSGSPALEQMTSAGQSNSGQDGSASLVLLPLAAEVLAYGAGAGAASVTLQTLSASASAQNAGNAISAATLRLMQAAGTGTSGQVASGAPSLELIVVSAGGHFEAIASGAAILPRPMAYGQAETQLAASLETWAMNVRSNAVTQYPEYPANSFARYNGTYLSAGPDGLSTLQEDDSEVEWTVRTGQMDDKKPTLKRITEVLMSMRYEGPIRVRIYQDDDTYYDYTLPSMRANKLQTVRAKPGKGLRSRYYMVELAGTGHMEMDSLQATMPETKRRIG